VYFLPGVAIRTWHPRTISRSECRLERLRDPANSLKDRELIFDAFGGTPVAFSCPEDSDAASDDTGVTRTRREAPLRRPEPDRNEWALPGIASSHPLDPT